jgi:hypothetical protein
MQISSFGNPTDVVELIDIPEPRPDVGLALIGVEFAPVNHNDMLLIKGTFHWTPSLPYLVGNEGVGRVLAVGPRVSTVKVGDRVLLPIYSGTWRKRVLVSAHGLVALPPEADVQQLAMLRINPTAAGLLLSEYVDLKPGDWVILRAEGAGLYSLSRNIGSSVPRRTRVSTFPVNLHRHRRPHLLRFAGDTPGSKYKARPATPQILFHRDRMILTAAAVNRIFSDPTIAQFWNPLTAAGRAALDAMITQQAQIIAYIDDYKAVDDRDARRDPAAHRLQAGVRR